MTSGSDRPRAPARGQQAVRVDDRGDGLDLDVQRAEVFALLGPNGAGKTTTVEMCEGFVRPDAGTSRSSASTPSPRTPGCANASASCCRAAVAIRRRGPARC